MTSVKSVWRYTFRSIPWRYRVVYFAFFGIYGARRFGGRKIVYLARQLGLWARNWYSRACVWMAALIMSYDL
jgi:hypothetical protein